MFDNPFLSDTPLGGGYQPSLRLDAKRGELYTVDPGGPGEDPRRTTVPIGTLVIIDFGCTLLGGVIFKPKFMERLVPLGAAMPTFPDNEPWQMATRLQVVVDGHGGLRSWLITGKIITRQMAQLRVLFGYRSEAAHGQIPVFKLTGFAPAQTEYGTFYTPILELVGFTDRDEGTYGPRLVPPPPPILAASVVPPALPEPTDPNASHEAPTVSDQPPTSAASSETLAATARPAAQSTPKSEPPETPPSPSGPDPFAAYRPVPLGKKPGGKKPY
jgi:hypothetical protein